ncbi:MAG TPA: HdeD family acid-resistance protein [Bryobacteraceae bacterium]|jgi:uncharacterized membrane protein HdeD (DUF308 family)|nr:HdeD family acid-resistance protein [Bryobacteraceae bacterium]
MQPTLTTPFVSINWWALFVRGTVAVIFGLIAFFLPVVTILSLTILFGAYALIDGIVSLIAAVRSARHGEHWWALLFEGIAGLAAAAITFVWPLITLVVLVYIIAAWALITGVLEIAAAFRLRHHVAGEWLLGLAGIFSIIFGVILFAAPGPGAVVLAWWIGAYIFFWGILLLILAVRLRHNPGSLHLRHA